MTTQLDPLFVAALAQPDSIKIIATADADGTPRLVEHDSLHLDDDGRLVLLETDEHAPGNRNLVRSIWFDRKIAIHVRDAAGRHFRVLGKPYKALIAGPRFELHYRRLQAENPPLALSTVWLIDPQVPAESEPAHHAPDGAAGRLPLIHLDRIARQ